MAVLEKQPSNTSGFLHFFLRKWLFSTACQQRCAADGHNQAVRQSEPPEADINTGRTGSTLPSFTYTYNDANQRVRVTLADSSYWLYEYDRLGQVIAGRKYWPDGTSVAGQQFEYGFDDIGNRKVARRGDDENGWNLRQSIYTANLLNQYSQRTVPGFVDIIGIALATKPVYVNGQMASRKGEYFRRELSVSNAGARCGWE